MPPKLILDPSDFPQEVLVDIEGIRAHNLQRFEMEQLTAITLIDPERKMVVGYKDVTDQEFWVRGHMPQYALMPGVIMCEAAAQLSAFYTRHCGLLRGDFIGFGGMDNVRFRGTVRPGERLWIIGKTQKHDLRRMTFEMQGFVEKTMVFHGDLIGVPIFINGPRESKEE